MLLEHAMHTTKYQKALTIRAAFSRELEEGRCRTTAAGGH